MKLDVAVAVGPESGTLLLTKGPSTQGRFDPAASNAHDYDSFMFSIPRERAADLLRWLYGEPPADGTFGFLRADAPEGKAE